MSVDHQSLQSLQSRSPYHHVGQSQGDGGADRVEIRDDPPHPPAGYRGGLAERFAEPLADLGLEQGHLGGGKSKSDRLSGRLAEDLRCERLELAPLSALEVAVSVAEALSARWVAKAAGRRRTMYASPAFGLAVHLKEHPDLVGLGPLAAARAVEDVLSRLRPDADDPWVAALPVEDSVGREHHGCESFALAWAEAQPRAISPLDLARWHAGRWPLRSPMPLPRRMTPALAIASLAWWLSKAADRRFYLAARTAGEHAACSPSTAARCLRLLAQESVLRCHRAGSHLERKAAEFTFAAEVRALSTNVEVLTV